MFPDFCYCAFAYAVFSFWNDFPYLCLANFTCLLDYKAAKFIELHISMTMLDQEYLFHKKFLFEIMM